MYKRNTKRTLSASLSCAYGYYFCRDTIAQLMAPLQQLIVVVTHIILSQVITNSNSSSLVATTGPHVSQPNM